MNEELVAHAIREISERSNVLRAFVHKVQIGDCVEEFLKVVMLPGAVPTVSLETELQKVVAKGVVPNEVVLEAVKAASLRRHSIMAQSLDRHFEYYHREFSSAHGRTSLLRLLPRRLQFASGAERLHPGDALFHVMLSHELGIVNTEPLSDDLEAGCIAFPLRPHDVVIGWVMARPSTKAPRRTAWPPVLEQPALFEPLARSFRRAMAENPRQPELRDYRFAILLQAGMSRARSYYLSDPVAIPSRMKVADVVKLAQAWRLEFQAVDDAESAIERHLRQARSDARIVDLAPVTTSTEIEIARQAADLADDLRSRRNLDLSEQVVARISGGTTGGDEVISDILWNVCGHAVGWLHSHHLIRETDGSWRWNPRPTVTLGGEEKPAGTTTEFAGALAAVCELATDTDDGEQRLCVGTGGYLHSRYSALTVPLSLIDRDARPEIIILLTDLPASWADRAARDVQQQIECAAEAVKDLPREAWKQTMQSLPPAFSMSDPVWYTKGLALTPGSRFHAEVMKLHRAIESWKSRPGKDVILVQGESRSGKGYSIKHVLKRLGFTSVKPQSGNAPSEAAALTMSAASAFKRFVEDGDTTLPPELRSSPRPLLFIDEYPDGDGPVPRGLLRLLAKEDEFPQLSDCTIIVASSGVSLLKDVHKRCVEQIFLPSITEHTADLVWSAARTMYEKLGCQAVTRSAVASILQTDWPNAAELTALLDSIGPIPDKVLRNDHLPLHFTPADSPELPLRRSSWPSHDRSQIPITP